MLSCHQCEGLEHQFDRRIAQRDLRRFRRKGPPRTTTLLIEDLRAAGVGGASLLDVGGGVGAIHHELLDVGASGAVHVDISPAYIEAARSEAERRRHAERVRFVRGDFIQLAPALPEVDIVTLDRVICCYPDMGLLVGQAADKAKRLFGAVYPRDVSWMRLGTALVNLFFRLRRSAFRVYVHSPVAIDALLRGRGFDRARRRRTIAWEVVTYRR